MSEEKAVVTGIDHGKVRIRRLQNGACGGCIRSSNCGAATLSELLPKREFEAGCEIALQVGDQVNVVIDESYLLFSSFLLYLLPLLVMLGCVIPAAAMLPATLADDWLPGITMAALWLAFWLIHRLQPLLLLHFCVSPLITGKL